jgi:hypothetical protein
MSTSSIGKRIRDAFAAQSGEFQSEALEQLVKYMDYAREAERESIQSARRSVLAALLTSATFLAFSTQLVDKVDLGPIELGSGSKLIVFLTSLSAYFFLDAMIKSNQAEQRRTAFIGAFRLWNKRAFDADLGLLITPDEPSFFAPSTVTRQASYLSPFDRRYEKLGVNLMVVTLFLPFVFEGVAFTLLFRASGFTDWVVWLNAALCLLLMSSYAMIFLAATDLADSDVDTDVENRD